MTNTGLARDDFWSGGLQRAVRELGVEGKLLVPSPREGYLPSFRSLARQRFDLVITATNEPVPAMVTVAREFPGPCRREPTFANPRIWASLTNVVNGKSVTSVPVALRTLRSRAFSINVHSADYAVVACGDIPRAS